MLWVERRQHPDSQCQHCFASPASWSYPEGDRYVFLWGGCASACKVNLFQVTLTLVVFIIP
jgi:hypothetical protein